MTFAPTHEAPFTPTGKVVFERSYARPKENGTLETWAETVHRVVQGNLKLVYGEPDDWSQDVQDEYQILCDYLYDFKIIPGGRHLWATGVGKRQYLANCHFAGWGDKFSDHFEFSFMRLMEGGGVGANYSSKYLTKYGAPQNTLKVHIVCDAEHKDYGDLSGAPALGAPNFLSSEFVSDWAGCYQIADSREGWAAALVDLIDTFWRTDVKHADRVYDVSIVRPKGSKLHTFGGTASGPLPLAKMLHEVAEVLNGATEFTQVTSMQAMAIDHSVAQCVVSGGVRRSARMSIVHWLDPYIADFIVSKKDETQNWTTNISVEIDSEFLAALVDETNPDHLWAVMVHQATVTGMLENGEPGYWNSTLSNEGEIDWVHGTNPCGEIPLNDWDVCNLGHVNLEAFWNDEEHTGLHRAHRLVTRMLIRATYGDFTDPKQAEIVQRNRRIGVGHFGVQGFLVKNGVRYSEAVNGDFPLLLRSLYDVVRNEARRYAFALRIPEPIKVTTVAPTGTIAKMPGATEGIHPVLFRYFIRRIRFSELRPEEMAQVEDYRSKGYKVEPCKYAANTLVVEIPTKERLVEEVEALGYPADIVETAEEIGLCGLLEFQAMYQEHWADNAVSFTVNFEPGRYTLPEAAGVIASFLPVLKGTTLMPNGTREQAPYEEISEEEFYRLTTLLGASNVEDSYDEQCATGACPIR